ncbi:MAG: dockerin type I domain-containing protein [Chthoniobacterales bacterium]
MIEIGGNANYGGCQTLTKRSDNGVTFTGNSVGLHGDVQVFAVAPSTSAIVWTGNDGGLWRSTDAGLNWTSMNGDPASSTDPTGKISASQYVSIATHPTDREYMTGGTQDNGTHFKRAAANAGAWNQIAFGDGGYTAIDQNATDTANVRIYHTFFNTAPGGPIEYEYAATTADAEARNWTNRSCVAGGAGNTRIDCNDTAVSFYAPLVLGPGNPNTVYFGTDRLYRSANGGDTMELVSQGPIAAAGVAITSISVGQGNDNVRLVGMRNGKVFATTTGGTLADVTPVGAPTATVGKVMVDPNNTDPNAITAYIAYGGLGTVAAPITHVWKTTNLAAGASSWVAMSNGLPDVPLDAIAIDSRSATPPAAASTLYLGTDIGVYRSTDGGANWAVFNPGNTLPVLPVFDMAFQGGSRILRIATHGRGIWEIQTAGGGAPTATSIVSRKVHGAAGVFDINLPLTGNAGVECRSGGATNDYQIVLSFPTTVTFSNATITSGTGTVSGTSGTCTNTLTVNLTGVADAQRLVITLTNVDDGTNTGDVGVRLGVLIGDVTGEGSVGSSDIALTKSLSGQTVGAGNFRADVNVSGAQINATDIAFVKSKSGGSLP